MCVGVCVGVCVKGREGDCFRYRLFIRGLILLHIEIINGTAFRRAIKIYCFLLF